MRGITNHLIVLGLLFTLGFKVEFAHAAKQKDKGWVAVNPSEVYSVITESGKTITCYFNGTAYVPGDMTQKGGEYRFSRADLLLKKQMKKLKRKKQQMSKKRWKSKRSALQKNYDDKQDACLGSDTLNPYKDDLTLAEAHHLFRRAGFGGTRAEVERAVQEGLEATVNRLTTEVSTPDLDQEVQAIMDENDYGNGPTSYGIQYAALHRMRYSPNQLAEKLAFFWHDLWAASYRVLEGQDYLLLEYVDILRDNALGNIRNIASGMTYNGLMLEWLDGSSNIRGSVNENYAREFWELFTLGIGHYTEEDIAESARAFTGWGLAWDNDTGRIYVRYNSSDFDFGTKSIFDGTSYEATGNFDAQDIIDHTFNEHPQAPRHFARALYFFFVHQEPSEAVVTQLAQQLLETNYEIAPVVRTILQSQAFFASIARRAGVKTPLEYAVGLLRNLELPHDLWELRTGLDAQGLILYNPPSVKGWDDDGYWLNNQWTLNRINLAQTIINNALSVDDDFSFQSLLPSADASVPEFVGHVASLMDVALTDQEVTNLENYMTTWREDGDEYEWEFDPNDEWPFYVKATGLVYLLAQHPSYQVR